MQRWVEQGIVSNLLSKLTNGGHLYAFDQDQTAIDHAHIRLASYIEKRDK